MNYELALRHVSVTVKLCEDDTAATIVALSGSL